MTKEALGSSKPQRSFDVFLSYNSSEDSVIARIANKLKQNNLNPWFDRWCLTPGGDWQEEIAEGLRLSAACAVFIGADGIGNFEDIEYKVAVNRLAEGGTFRLFPVLLPSLPEPFAADSLPSFLSTRTWVDLRKGLSEPFAFQSLINAIKGIAPGPEKAIEPRNDTCPYRGLDRFKEEHAELFFGRVGEIQRLVEKLKTTTFLAVLGPSGNGKSSLVLAGLLPALRSGVLPGSESWDIRVLNPTASPLSMLASHLSHLNPDRDIGQILDELKTDDRAFHLNAVRALTGSSDWSRIVWAVDQFEEAFTLCADQDERKRFFGNLLYAASSPQSRNMIVLTLRADFYQKCAIYPELAAHISSQQFLVSPMDGESLRQAIEKPAWQVGLEFEQGLVETILAEVGKQPSALPLLEYALLQLWRLRRGRMLTLEGYNESGGVTRAIAERAETIYNQEFNAKQQVAAKSILLRLTQPGEGTEDTRRQAQMSELVTDVNNRTAIEGVVNILSGARLLTVDVDQQSGHEVVNVSHEALIRGWPRLREWIEKDRAGLLIHRRLTDAANEWLRLNQEEGLLYRGVRLGQALEWQDQNRAALNKIETEFLDASVELRRREQEEKEERQRRELEAARRLAQTERRARRRQRLFTIGLSILLGLAVLASFIAFKQERASRSGELAASATSQLDQDPESSLVLALEALRVRHTPEAEEVLRQALLNSRLRAVYGENPPDTDLYSPESKAVSDAKFSPDGQSVLTWGFGHTAYLWESATGRTIAELRGHRMTLTTVVFSPDGRWIFTKSYPDGSVRIWNAKTGECLLIKDGSTGEIKTETSDENASAELFAFIEKLKAEAKAKAEAEAGKEQPQIAGAFAYSDDGKLALTHSAVDGTLILGWLKHSGKKSEEKAEEESEDLFSLKSVFVVDVATKRTVAILKGHEDGVSCAAFSKNGELIVTGSKDNTARVWEAKTGKQVAEMRGHTRWVDKVRFSANGKLVMTNGLDETARIWDAVTGQLIIELPGQNIGGIHTIDFSADDKYVLTISGDYKARVWDIGSKRSLTELRGHRKEILYAAFSPDNRLIVTAGQDGIARISEIGAIQNAIILPNGKRPVRSSVFSPNSKLVVLITAEDCSVWSVTGEKLATFPCSGGKENSVAFSPDGARLVAIRGDVAQVLDTASWQATLELRGHSDLITSVAYDPNGKYVVTSSRDKTAKVWETGTGTCVATLNGHSDSVQRATFSNDGQRIATASNDGTARVWDAITGQSLTEMTGHTSAVNSAAFSPDGARVVTASDDGTARIWAASTGRRLAELRGHSLEVLSAEFSSDDKLIITSSKDHDGIVWNAGTGTVMIKLHSYWQPSSGRTLSEGPPPARDLFSAKFSPDGRWAITAGANGTALAYPWEMYAPFEDIIKLAQTRASRKLTGDERRRYLNKSIFPW